MAQRFGNMVADGFGQVANPKIYQTGICSCCDDNAVCRDGLCCPYCQLGYISKKLGSGEMTMDYCICCGSLVADAVFFMGLCLMGNGCRQRQSVNQRFGIEESGCSSCIYSVFCPLCNICQIHREMNARAMWPGAVCYAPPPEAFLIAAPQMMTMAGGPVQQGRPVQYGQPVRSKNAV